MSIAETDVPLEPLGKWLPELSATRILELAGARAWSRAHEYARRLQGRPQAMGGRLVQAPMNEKGGSCAVSVGVATEGMLACHCECESFCWEPPCPHVAGLLLALANDPGLRARLCGGTDTQERTGADEAKRRAAAQELVRRRGIDLEGTQSGLAPAQLLDLTFAAWRRRGTQRPVGTAAFTLEVENNSESPEDAPILRVTVLPEGSRKPFEPDELESRRLPATEWRLLEPLARSPSRSRQFLAAGSLASTFLERAAEVNVSLNEGDSESSVKAITQAALRPALRLRRALDNESQDHPIVVDDRRQRREHERELHEAWVAYTAIVEPISESEFLELLGIVGDEGSARLTDKLVLEAQWIAAHPEGAPSYLPLPAAIADSVIFRGATTWVYLRESRTFAKVAPDVGPISLARLIEQPRLILSREEVVQLPALLADHFLGEGVELPRRSELGLPPLPRPHIVLRATGSVFEVEARLEAQYEHGKVLLEPSACADARNDQRDGQAERAATDSLATTSLMLEGRSPNRRRRNSPRLAETEPVYRAEGESAVQFWTQELPQIVARAGRGGAIDEAAVPAELRHVRVREPVRSRLEGGAAAGGLLSIALAFGSEGIPADLEAIRAAMEAKRRWVRLTDGSIASFSGRVAELAAAVGDRLGPDGQAELPRNALGETRLWEELADEVSADDALSSWTERLRTLEVAAEPAPVAALRGTLREYQRTGLAWLQFLAELEVGGILADDMGLGKTIQALALIAWRAERDGPAPTLVVAPTSVAPNWIREANRFVPDLKTLLLHGADRHARRDEVPGSDLVITTYALLRRDIAALRDVPFRYVILDEAQHIKNHTAATTAAARALKAESRLALTGTPLENRLLELWSIVEFVNPGMLGSWRDFNRRWERPVAAAIENEAQNNKPRDTAGRAEAASLRARLRPFLLRRTKADVQRDLPPKIETDVVVELTEAQRRAYSALAATTREDIGRRLEDDGMDKNRMLILTALLRLRQMACDPRLVDPRHKASDSAKLGALRELISEVIASGRRALVFSQFVQLLSLVRADLDEQGIEYAYLDGRTRDRDGTIQGFIEGTMPVFLLSLRAGGTGINLAAADVVIHLDPWWNPAVEEQATDRAHRIGQDKTVSVYRIVAAGTIEEGILRLKERKRALARAVIDDTDSSLPSGITQEDVIELLAL